nr:AraC family transcriptional regulator [Clostridia bacterium]
AQTLRRMVSFSTLTLLTALLLGFGLMCLFLKRHYSPVHRILSVIGTKEAPAGNEYDHILSACQSLTSENTSIKDRLRVQEAYIQEKFLLSRLLGRGVRPSDQGIAQRTASLFDGKILRMAAFCLSLPEDGDTRLAEHFDTMQFNVHCLLLEQLGGSHEPLRVIDNNCLVYLFPLTRQQNDVWLDEAVAFAGAVCELFEDRFHLPLLAVLSNPCERLELCHELYTQVSSVTECLSAAGESGAIPVRDVLKQNDHLKTSRHISGYKLREAIARGDAGAADQHLTELFGYITEKSALSFQVTRFLYFSIIRLVGKAFDDALPDDAEGHDQAQIQMGQLMLCGDQDETERAVRKFVRDTCGYILRHKVASSEGVARSVCEYIQRHYTDVNLNISHIACALNLCPQTVTKYCKQETSMSVLDYIARIRIDQAKRLATQSEMTLEDLSKAVGYASVRTFHRAYAKLEGTTPGRGLGRV